jgi:hypothetical protein
VKQLQVIGRSEPTGGAHGGNLLNNGDEVVEGVGDGSWQWVPWFITCRLNDQVELQFREEFAIRGLFGATELFIFVESRMNLILVFLLAVKLS